MFRAFLFFVFLTIGIALGVLYAKSLGKIFPNYPKKPSRALAIVMFAGVSMSVFITTTIHSCLNSTLLNLSTTLERHALENIPNQEIARAGISLNQLNDMLLQATSNGREMIESVLPARNEFGASVFIYDVIVNTTSDIIDSYILDLRRGVASNIINVFIDPNGDLTVGSIINGLRLNIISRITRVLLIVVIVANIPFYIYLSVTIIMRMVKSKEGAKNINDT